MSAEMAKTLPRARHAYIRLKFGTSRSNSKVNEVTAVPGTELDQVSGPFKVQLELADSLTEKAQLYSAPPKLTSTSFSSLLFCYAVLCILLCCLLSAACKQLLSFHQISANNHVSGRSLCVCTGQSIPGQTHPPHTHGPVGLSS